MKKILAAFGLFFILILGANTTTFAQAKTIPINVSTLDGDLFDYCEATVEVKENGDWVVSTSMRVVRSNSFSFNLTLNRNDTFRVKLKGKQGQIENERTSKIYIMANISGLNLLLDFYVARSNYVLLEEQDE